VPSSEKIKSVLKRNKNQKIKSELLGGVFFFDEVEQRRGIKDVPGRPELINHGFAKLKKEGQP
jgi:hypothetical protein